MKSALIVSSLLGAALSSPAALPVKLQTRSSLNSRLSNVHLEYLLPVEGHISFTYGSCHSTQERDAHHVIGRSIDSTHDRLVWIIPEDVFTRGCISAWASDGRLVGRSEEQHVAPKNVLRRRGDSNSIAMTNATGIDAWGAWFDGVAVLKASNLSSLDVTKAKNKNIAIVGAGMAGLMTYLCLTQAGMKNVEIIEAGQRLGGRVHTEYLSGGPFDYSYQEMGPMRFPTTIKLANVTYNVSDHQMVFQLADELNHLNKGSKNLSVDFIPWLQSSSNGLVYRNGIRLPNGMPPTQAQVAANSSLKVPSILDKSTLELQEEVDKALPGQEFFVKMAVNMFKAHREFLGKLQLLDVLLI